MSEDRQTRRAERLAQRAERLASLLAALESGERPNGPIFQIIERIEQGLDGLPGALGKLEDTLSELGVDEDDLPLGLGQRTQTLKLALAISKEIGGKLPLDTLLSFLPGIPGNVAERGLLLPLSLGLAAAWRSRTDPGVLAKRVAKLRRKLDRARRGEGD